MYVCMNMYMSIHTLILKQELDINVFTLMCSFHQICDWHHLGLINIGVPYYFPLVT